MTKLTNRRSLSMVVETDLDYKLQGINQSRAFGVKKIVTGNTRELS